MQTLLRLLALVSLLTALPLARAQTRTYSYSFVAPQARPWNRPPAQGSLTLTAAEAGVDVTGQVATTTLDFALTNAFATRLESQMVIPVPEGAVLRGFHNAPGVGLGLALCHRLARSLGGELVHDTTVATRASFILKLPRA